MFQLSWVFETYRKKSKDDNQHDQWDLEEGGRRERVEPADAA